MSELIVAGFNGELSADEVLLDLEKLQQVHKINLDDAVVVVRRGDGSLRIKHTNLLVTSDAAIGSLLGMVLGPAGMLVGGVIGAAVGETVKVLTNIGIDDYFVKEVATILEPGCSAIFFKVHKSVSEDVVKELKEFGAKLLRSSLSIKDERELVMALQDAAVVQVQSQLAARSAGAPA